MLPKVGLNKAQMSRYTIFILVPGVDHFNGEFGNNAMHFSKRKTVIS